VRPWRVEVVNDDYGKESYRIRVYYRGPLSRTRGDPRAIRLDVPRQETLVFPCRDRAILHSYDDAEKLAHIRVPCYDLREMAVEKLRALTGQRRYAVSRDLYDVVQLLTLLGGDAPALLSAFPAKWHVKGLSWGAIDLQHLAARRAEFLEDWNNHLLRVLPAIAAPDFDDTWQKACAFVADLNRRAAGPKP